MKAELKSLHLENFKGVKDKVYEFGSLTKVSGMNRLGKTTIADAWFWLFSDKNYDLHSNPNIRPNDVEECIPMVTAVLDVDGKEVTITKMQKRSVSKPNDKGISKITLTNTYTINEVPKTERDFKAYLEELGFAFNKFLVCGHTNVFVSQKTADMRKALFEMASEKSDYDIAVMSDETFEVAKMLANYKYEEIEAMQKASKKKAEEQVEAIPNQIVGLEKAKVDIDVAEQELAKADLERKIMAIKSKISDAGSSVSVLMEEELRLQFELSGMMQNMNRELFSKRNDLDKQVQECRFDLNDVQNHIVAVEKQIANNSLLIERAEKKRGELAAEYNIEKTKVFDETPCRFCEDEWHFDESETVCKSCGQMLPMDKIEQMKAAFEERKEKARLDSENRMRDAKERFESKHAADLKKICDAGFEQKALITKLADENENLQSESEVLKKQEQEIIAKKNVLEKQLAELPKEADYSQNAEYAELKVKHDAVRAEIAKVNSVGHDELMAQFEEEKEELQRELDAVKEKIALSVNNVRIDEQISELQEKHRNYEQVKADAEKILYQLSLISKKKNELLVEEINNHFSIVKWLLFDYQKNGEYKEVCIPMIDGKRFGESTNTGREIEAKLDICNSFQKFFDMQIPIFLDGAESLNDCYMPKLDTQLITLSVSEDRELKVEVA